MVNRRSMLAACGGILVLLTVVSVNAWPTANRATPLTFGGPVALPGVTLGAGTYVFELADPDLGWDIVRVRSHNRSRVYFMGFTNRIERPAGMPADRQISFGEAPAAMAAPITAWYHEGESTGHQFIYSK